MAAERLPSKGAALPLAQIPVRRRLRCRARLEHCRRSGRACPAPAAVLARAALNAFFTSCVASGAHCDGLVHGDVERRRYHHHCRDSARADSLSNVTALDDLRPDVSAAGARLPERRRARRQHEQRRAQKPKERACPGQRALCGEGGIRILRLVFPSSFAQFLGYWRPRYRSLAASGGRFGRLRDDSRERFRQGSERRTNARARG